METGILNNIFKTHLMQFLGYFSEDPTINPMMHNWNSVHLKYCDGNSFSGSNSSTTVYENTTLHWRGKHILEAVMEDLLTKRGLNLASDVVVGGSSAGGLATYLHCDKWAENLKGKKVVCMPDSGLFLDYEGEP